MIKRAIFAAVGLMVCLLATGVKDARAEFKINEWEFYRPIDTAGMQAGRNYRILLDGSVYDGAQASLADLRLITQERFESPYTIAMVRGTSETRDMTSIILENSRAADNSNIVVLDLGEKVRPNNKIILEITERNFGKKVTVEGSNDRAHWAVLTKDAYIYNFSFGGEQVHRSGEVKWNRAISSKYMVDFSYSSSSSDTSIAYPQSDFRYLRVTLFGAKDEEPVTVTQAKVTSHYVIPAEESTYTCVVQDKKIDAQEKTSQAILDFNWKNLPVERVKIECDGSNYYRTVYVQVSNDLKNWDSIGSGEVFDYNVENFKDAKKEIRFPETRSRYIKLTILNQDNVPINVVSATGYGLKRYLVFPFQKAGSLRLYYGSPRAPSPDYDYARFAGKADFTAMPFVQIAQQFRNSGYAPEKIKRPWTEEHPYLLWIAVITIVMILLFLVASMIKSVKQ